MRTYLTYTRFKEGNNYKDPQDLMNYRWGSVFKFRETWAMGLSVDDPRIIACIDHESKEVQIQDMVSKDGLFEFELISEEKVIEKMNLWYGEGLWEFDVSERDNVFKDLRPREEI